MSRYPGGGQLPPLQWNERDSPNQQRFHHRSNPIKPNYIQQGGGTYNGTAFEDSLASRVVQLEQELSRSLTGGTGGTGHAHFALQDHINTVTLALKKITNEIEAIEEQLRTRMHISEHTKESVKSLEMQHAGSITDLRQRVGRCDVSIAKLSADSRRCNDAVASLAKQSHSHYSTHGKVASDLERKISNLENQIMKLSTEQHSKVDTVGSETKHAVALLEARTKNQFEELQRALDTIRMRGDSDRQLLERGLEATVEVAVSKRDTKQELFERKILDRLDDIDKKLTSQERARQALTDKIQSTLEERMHRLEATLRQEQEKLDARITQDLREARDETENGFKRVQDSMATMRIILEGKQQILVDSLGKQLANVKKLVVLT